MPSARVADQGIRHGTGHQARSNAPPITHGTMIASTLKVLLAGPP